MQITDADLDFAIERKLRVLVSGKVVDPSPEILKIAHVTGPLIMVGIGEVCAITGFIGGTALGKKNQKPM